MYLTPKREVYKQSLSGEQERWRSQSDNKAQKFEQLSYHHFKTEGLNVIKYLFQQNDYM